MDAKQAKNINQGISYYESCDELPVYNFEKAKKGELWWLIDHPKSYSMRAEADEKKLSAIWKKILDQYASLVDSNHLYGYYELICDLAYQNLRLKSVTAMIYQINSRKDSMPKQTIEAYAKELREWGFLVNLSKPLDDEIQRMIRQAKAAKSKISIMSKKKKDIEKGNKNKVPFLKVKTRVENQIKRSIDTRVTTVSEWVYIIEDIKNNVK